MKGSLSLDRARSARRFRSAESVARTLAANAERFGVLPEDLAELELASSHTSPHSGVTHYYFRQLASGIEVFRGRVAVAIESSGRLIAVGVHLVAGAGGRLDTLVPAIDPVGALRRAAKGAGLDGATLSPSLLEDRGGADGHRIFAEARLSREPIPVRLKLVATEAGVRLAWSVVLYLPDGSDAGERLIDAVTGAELERQSFVAHAAPRYKVFPIQRRGDPSVLPVESPAHGAQIELDDAVLATADPTASPAGWLDTIGNDCAGETIGNNSESGEDVAGTIVRADGGPSCDFRFSPDLDLAYLDSNPPLADYRAPALTNLFYATNVLHDIFYLHGFDEAAGNLQQDNFGRGGVGGDRLVARRNVMSNNSRLLWAPDGTSPTLLMGEREVHSPFLATFQAPSGAAGGAALTAADLDRDGDIDLVAANEDTANVTLFHNDGAGGFPWAGRINLTLAPSSGPVAIVSGDFDGQNGPDLATANPASNDVSILSNDGGGYVFLVSQYGPLDYFGISAPSAIAAGDLDGDGDPDLVTANSGSSNLSILENTWGSFGTYPQNIALSGVPRSVVVAELTGDALPDLAVALSSPPAVALLVNDGGLSFSPPQTISFVASPSSDPVDLAAADFDGDGDLDLVVLDAGDRSAVLIANVGGGSFKKVWETVTAGPERGGRIALGSSGRQPAAITTLTVAGTGPDIAVVDAVLNNVSIRRNRHDKEPWFFTHNLGSPQLGLIEHPIGAGPCRGLVAAGLDSTGNDDIAVVLDTSPTQIAVLRDGDGRYITSAVAYTRDNSLDNGYIVHEWGHAVSWRLTGGPDATNLTGAQSNGMAEGWSDFFALVFTQTASPEEPRGIFNFWGGAQGDGWGFRSLPYSRNLEVNPLTFARYNTRRSTAHDVGEIWASTLWDIYWSLCDPAVHGRSGDLYRSAYGSAPGGENVALQLVIDGLELQPPDPTFLEARDAILIADSVDFGGSHVELLWEAFRLRGMGWGACDNWISSGNPPYCWIAYSDSTEVLEDFTTPPSGTIGGTVFDDTDCDGTRDAGEPGLAGWRVYLDANRNGRQDAGEESRVTDSSGNYEFTGLYPTLRPSRDWIGGATLTPVAIPYLVSLEVQAGWKHPVTFLGNWNGSQGYADLWADGGYAFLGHEGNRVEIVDVEALVADPSDPAGALAGVWTSGNPSDRFLDVKAAGGTAYFASDFVTGDVYVVDVRDPASPTQLAVIASGLSGVHNLSLDGDYLYLADGRTNHVACWDVSVPQSPQPRGLKPAFKVEDGSGGPVHDITARDGRLYVCESGTPGWIHVYDSAAWWPATRLGSFQSGNLTHSCWPTEDGGYLAVTREEAGVSLTVDIWDIRGLDPLDPDNPANVRRAAQLSVPAGEASLPHDPRIAGDRLYVSWYEAGVVAFDISDPEQPFEVARYDTYGGPLSAETGCWGVDPFEAPSRVLASDTESGLYVLSFTPSSSVDLEGGEARQGVDFALSQSCGW